MVLIENFQRAKVRKVLIIAATWVIVRKITGRPCKELGITLRRRS